MRTKVATAMRVKMVISDIKPSSLAAGTNILESVIISIFRLCTIYVPTVV